jgi:DNA repair ATPase RecN
MDDKQYRVWWNLHRPVATGETLTKEESHAYQAGGEELDTEEWVSLRTAWAALQPLRKRLRELTAQNKELARQETVLRQQVAELEHQYLLITGEPLGIET